MKKIKLFFEELFMAFVPLAGVVCLIFSVKNRDEVLLLIAVILFALVFWKRKNYTDAGYIPNGE